MVRPDKQVGTNVRAFPAPGRFDRWGIARQIHADVRCIPTKGRFDLLIPKTGQTYPHTNHGPKGERPLRSNQFPMFRNRLVLAAIILCAAGPSTSRCQTVPAAPDPIGQMPPTVAAGDRLTLDRAETLAFGLNPTIKAALANVKGARSNLEGQRVPANPQFAVAGINNTVTNSFDQPSDYNFLFTIETNGAIQWRTSQAANQWRQSLADAERAHATVRQSVAGAYVDLQVANANLQDEVEATDTATKLSDLAESQFKLGAAPETNAIRARIAVTQEEENLLRAISTVETARANLDIQIGRDAKTPIDVSEPLSYTPVNVSVEELTKIADTHRPELRSAEYNLKALQAAVGLQRTQNYPVVYVGTDLNQVGHGSFELGLAMPLFDFGSIRGSVEKAQHDVEAQQAQNAQTVQSVSLDVQSAYSELQRSQRTVEAFQDGIIPRTKSLLDRVEKGFKLGAETILDLIDAQETYRSARNDYNNALGDHRRALAQLEHAIGEPIHRQWMASQSKGDSHG